MVSASLGVSDLTGFADLFAGEADVLGRGRSRRIFPAGTFAPRPCDFAPFLARVVLVGEATNRKVDILRFATVRPARAQEELANPEGWKFGVDLLSPAHTGFRAQVEAFFNFAVR